MKHDVVMVDDEETLVWSTGQQLARARPDIAFEAFTDPLVALSRLRERPPDLLITDVRMPRVSGLELTMAARSVRPELPVIVVTAYGSPEVLEVARAPQTRYLEKPFSFAQLLSSIDALLGREEGFSGAVSLPMLPDLIQLYTLSLANGALRIARAGREGTIWFERGELVHAELESLRGEQAVQQMLAWKGGSFSLDARAKPPERSIDASWQEVLLEACRLLDEDQRDSEKGTDELVEAALAPTGMPLASATQVAHPVVAPDQPEPTAKPSDSSDGLASLAEDLGWPTLAELRKALPAAVILAVDLARGRLEPLQGGPPRDHQLLDLSRLLDQIQRCGPAVTGSLEWTSATQAGALVFDRSRKLALLLAAPLRGAIEAARFRSLVIRANLQRDVRGAG